MKVYKLTDDNNRTYNDTQWGINVTHTAPGIGPLCSSGWIHCYSNPLLAILLNPIHANFVQPRLWVAETPGNSPQLDDNGCKLGVTSLTTLHLTDTPIVTDEARVTFAILCAAHVNASPNWRRWAASWLNGEDRTRPSAYAATAAAYAADAADAAAYAAAAYAAAYATAADAATRLNLATLATDATAGGYCALPALMHRAEANNR